MVSLLRRPFGFAVLAVVFVTVLGMLRSMLLQRERDTLFLMGTVILFTFIYAILVQAHLSHHFRLRASIYIPLIALAVLLGLDAMANFDMFMFIIQDYHTWLTALIQFVISYVLITIGNWGASFVVKTKGHI